MAGVVFTGVGRPEGKPSLKSWATKMFTFEGNEKAWRDSHTKDIAEMTAINASLSPEQREQVMEKLDKAISRVAKVKVIRNYGVVALVTALFGGSAVALARKIMTSSRGMPSVPVALIPSIIK